MSAQCATCRLRGTNGLRQNVHREFFFWGERCKEQRMASTVAKKLPKTSYCEVVWGQPRHARYAALLYIYFNSQHFYFFSLQFLLGISVPFTSVTASSKRHLCFVQTWCETPLFRYMKKKKTCLHFVPFLKTKMGIDEKKKNFYTMLWWRHQHRQRKGGAHLTLKGANGQARNWPVMIVMDARVCWPLARCISENDWGFGGL